MPVIGLNFKSFEAKREKDAIDGEIKINSTPKIIDIKEVDVSSLGKKALSLDFDFVTTYDPQIAKFRITGDILFLTDNNEGILKQWKKEKKLPDDASIEILNHLFRRCLLKLSSIADDLQLPPPIQIPRVRPKSEGTDYIG